MRKVLMRRVSGICYEGGLDCRGRPADTRTPEQKAAPAAGVSIETTLLRLPGVRTPGSQSDLNGDGEIEPEEEWIKACPVL